MAAEIISIKITGLEALAKKLPGQPSIVSRGLKRIMDRAAKAAAAIWRSATPVKSGRLQRSVRAQSTALRAKVIWDPVGRAKFRGSPFRYGWALSTNRRYRRTFGYVKRAEQQIAAGPAKAAAREIAAEIKRQWGAG